MKIEGGEMIAEGQVVEWIHVVRRGKTIDMTLRTGTVLSIEGDVATISYGKNHRRKKIEVKYLRPLFVGNRN